MGKIFVTALLLVSVFVWLRRLIGKSDCAAADAPPATCWQQIMTAIPNCRTVVVGLLVVFGMMEFLAPELPARVFDMSDAWSRVAQRFWDQDEFGDHVAVAVGSPAVQTRERLINDRFEQVAWMDMLLKSTMTVTAPGLSLPDQPQKISPWKDVITGGTQTDKARSTNSVADGDRDKATDDTAPSLSGSTASTVADTEYGGEQTAWFLRMRYFRDQLRAERADAMLDDRHDIDDNTLYRLAFDVTVTPERGVDAFAAVHVLLTNNPRELESVVTGGGQKMPGDGSVTATMKDPAIQRFRAFQRRDIFDMYMNWLQVTQSIVNDNIVDSNNEFASPGIQKPELFYQMLVEACQTVSHRISPWSDLSGLRKSCQQAVRGEKVEQTVVEDVNNRIYAILDAIEVKFRLAYATDYRQLVGLPDGTPGAGPQLTETDLLRLLRRHLIELSSFSRNSPGHPLARYDDQITQWLNHPEQIIPDYQEVATYCFAANSNPSPNTNVFQLSGLQDVYQAMEQSAQPIDNQPREVNTPAPTRLTISCPAIYGPLDRLLTLDALLRALETDSLDLPAATRAIEVSVDDRTTPAAPDRRDAVGKHAVFHFDDRDVTLLRSRVCLEARQLAGLLRDGPPEVVPGRGGLHYGSFFDISILSQRDGQCSLTLSPKTASLLKKSADDTGERELTLSPSDRCNNDLAPLVKAEFSDKSAFRPLKIDRDYESLNWIVVKRGDDYVAMIPEPDHPLMYRLKNWRCADAGSRPFTVKVGGEVNILGKLAILLDSNSYSGDAPTPVTQAFPYELTPRAARSHKLEVQEENALGATALKYKLSARTNRDKASNYEDEPVVGFIPHHRSTRPPSGNVAEFGWIIAPRATAENRSALGLESDQLGALVSVPSWWRTALIRICATAVGSADLPNAVYSNFWQERSSTDACRIETVRLPGTGAEISRHLGIEVLTTPYVRKLAFQVSTTKLQAGDPAKVLLQGGRLWRNTVVTLGGQRADQIVVLPDLRGIIAEFGCIERPHLVASLPQQCPVSSADPGTCFNSVPVKVWTSEGETTPPNFVTVVVPKSFHGCKARDAPVEDRPSRSSIDFQTNAVSIHSTQVPDPKQVGQ